MNIKVPSLSALFSVVSKLGGAAIAAYGINVHSISTMTIGAAYAAAVHLVDSIWNSPSDQHPAP